MSAQYTSAETLAALAFIRHERNMIQVPKNYYKSDFFGLGSAPTEVNKSMDPELYPPGLIKTRYQWMEEEDFTSLSSGLPDGCYHHPRCYRSVLSPTQPPLAQWWDCQKLPSPFPSIAELLGVSLSLGQTPKPYLTFPKVSAITGVIPGFHASFVTAELLECHTLGLVKDQLKTTYFPPPAPNRKLFRNRTLLKISKSSLRTFLWKRKRDLSLPGYQPGYHWSSYMKKHTFEVPTPQQICFKKAASAYLSEMLKSCRKVEEPESWMKVPWPDKKATGNAMPAASRNFYAIDTDGMDKTLFILPLELKPVLVSTVFE
ncbi:hypothetical protein llap_5848 [Limosa lapponica baueri]|uniref:Uncharacterized protein n=1 Tax=Limosa lapponica baueri TaxID=1758121 RepID=A0A2I0UCS2_LIMLA|nr:hypothetical protein llap_5848 [Limosa lapponica baueri]